jgi:tetratricopeptide (TPR) repeat protein
MHSNSELGLESVPFYEGQLRDLEQVAERARQMGNARALAEAELSQGRVKEKLGDFLEAIALARTAHARFHNAGDASGVALCCHTTAVWAFHHGDDVKSLQDFRTAVQIRGTAGEFLLEAQSWHNLGYVQCRTGRPDDAFRSYHEAQRILERLRLGRLASLSASADRALGFVFSHLAFANAKYRSRDDAMTATMAYFEHTARTKVHKEPILAYLAPPIALAFDKKELDADLASRIGKHGGLEMAPDLWFRYALEESSRALLAHEAGSGRRPYLGARLLALAESGLWFLNEGQEQLGQMLIAEAVALASARGWIGEVGRFSSMRCADANAARLKAQA